MSAPYTHTVELPYTYARCTDQIATLVDNQFALILTDAKYAEVAECAWRATRITGNYYRVAIHDDDTNSIIISRIS